MLTVETEEESQVREVHRGQQVKDGSHDERYVNAFAINTLMVLTNGHLVGCGWFAQ